jgi:hypothetical protein
MTPALALREARFRSGSRLSPALNVFERVRPMPLGSASHAQNHSYPTPGHIVKRMTPL